MYGLNCHLMIIYRDLSETKDDYKKEATFKNQNDDPVNIIISKLM